MNSNEILAGRANHNNSVDDFSMHRVKFEKTGKFFQISILFHPHHLCWHTGVYSLNAVLQPLAAKQDGRVVRALDFNAVTPGSNPALAASWCCSGFASRRLGFLSC